MAEQKNSRLWINIGWAATLLGCALWTYGYFAGGSPSIFDWPVFAPQWIAEYIPNLQTEVGMVLALLGSIPLYYAQFQEYRNRH